MNLILIALVAGVTVSSPPAPSVVAPPIGPAHAAHLRQMLENDGNAAVMDIAIKAMHDDMMRAAAKSRNEPVLTADETQRFERISQPVLGRLKQGYIDTMTQGLAALSDDDIGDLMRCNDTPLGRRFISHMVRSQAPDEARFNTYVSETASAISAAYANKTGYAAVTPSQTFSGDTPEQRLLIETGNAAMIDEAVEDYLNLSVGNRITGVDFANLSDDDSARLRGLYLDGLRDLADRMKAMKASGLRAAFSQAELESLIKLYALPALQTKVRLSMAMLPEGRTQNFAAAKTAYDEVLAEFARQSGEK